MNFTFFYRFFRCIFSPKPQNQRIFIVLHLKCFFKTLNTKIFSSRDRQKSREIFTVSRVDSELRTPLVFCHDFMISFYLLYLKNAWKVSLSDCVLDLGIDPGPHWGPQTPSAHLWPFEIHIGPSH